MCFQTHERNGAALDGVEDAIRIAAASGTRRWRAHPRLGSHVCPSGDAANPDEAQPRDASLRSPALCQRSALRAIAQPWRLPTGEHRHRGCNTET
jgi:hypothetical protein